MLVKTAQGEFNADPLTIGKQVETYVFNETPVYIGGRAGINLQPRNSLNIQSIEDDELANRLDAQLLAEPGEEGSIINIEGRGEFREIRGNLIPDNTNQKAVSVYLLLRAADTLPRVD